MAADLWRSDRLIYRGIDNDDEDFLFDLNVDADAFLNAAPILPVPRSKKTAQEFREYLQQPMFLLAAIACLQPTPAEEIKTEESENDDKAKEKPKPTPIGIVTLRGDDAKNIHHRRCEIGIHLIPQYRGQGYGTEAIKWSLRWGFKRANLHRMGLGAFSWNTGSIKLYERLGFVHEARKRDFWWHNGRYHDSVELAMLEDEWRARYDS